MLVPISVSASLFRAVKLFVAAYNLIIHQKNTKMEINFKKVHAPKDLIISGIILIAGIGLFFIQKALGICVVLCGLLCLLVYKSGYRLDGLDVLLKKKQLELNKSCLSSVLDFINGKNVVPQLVEGNEGGTVLLEVWYNKAAGIAYARLSEYKELSFQNVTGIVELTAENAQSLISRL